MTTSISFSFELEVVNGWPPVTSETLPFKARDDGFALLTAPLFLKDLSVGDVLQIDFGENGCVQSWRHVERSTRSTIWLLRTAEPTGIKAVLYNLRQLGCNTVSLPSAGSYAVDVPEEVALEWVDRQLAKLMPDSVAIAYPSLRHTE